MFFVGITPGILSESTALIADSLDMLAATVYGIELYAVGRALSAKIRAARISGIFQMIFGASVSFEVFRRFVWGQKSESFLLISVGVVMSDDWRS